MTMTVMGPVRLERTITFGLIMTLILQTAGGLIWVGAAEARLTELEHEFESQLAISERLARLEGETAIMRSSVLRIEQTLVRTKGDRP
ncbi:hypothetical protein ACFFUB_14655 [Algimonas porphyrae]|uniref:Cell division protein FtsL n=1 Tax=Algimonas porphyrae TaxID=1128113 RepID=A0ABQ5UY76_9PROT|nr:hypothetical protein [Algimonas porphyrae]GLQ19667.1 hypothetical protein GCM10007854_06220 [Algimonas porphyrae]